MHRNEERIRNINSDLLTTFNPKLTFKPLKKCQLLLLLLS